MSIQRTREVRKLIRRLEKDGWSARKTGGGHWVVRSPEGVPVSMPSSPSDHRSMKNVMAKLKRAGWTP